MGATSFGGDVNYCEQCGSKFATNAKFCEGCGSARAEYLPDSPGEDSVETLAEVIVKQVRQLITNENILKFHFYADGIEAFSMEHDLGVVDTAFGAEHSGSLDYWEPLDDENDLTSTPRKHVYLEPEDFFDLNGEDVGRALVRDLLTLHKCREPNDVKVSATLKDRRGPKASFLLPEL
jgi:hypothetical protein